jgi:hypothetical protein
MPKDYKKGVIYKLVSQDLEVPEIYVGSTTNFNQRRQRHKSACANINDKKSDIRVYQYIRENGDWEMWDMILVEEYPCENRLQLLARERYHIEQLKSKLNCCIPTRTRKEHYQECHEEILKQKKEYRQNNLEKVRGWDKKHYEENKDKIRDRQKVYAEGHKVEKSITDKKYREENKEKVDANKKMIIHCDDCDIDYQKNNTYQHIKSIQHRKNVGEDLNLLTCDDCGRQYTKQNKKRHDSTEYHQKRLKKMECVNV